jgi:hypothetical protein
MRPARRRKGIYKSPAMAHPRFVMLIISEWAHRLQIIAGFALFFAALFATVIAIALFALSESPLSRGHIRRRLVGLPIIACHTVAITCSLFFLFRTGAVGCIFLLLVFLPQAYAVWRILLFPRARGGGGGGPDRPRPLPPRPPSARKPLPAETSLSWREKVLSKKDSCELN